MYKHFELLVTKYKDYFPKNRPAGALDNTILMLRLIHRNRVFAMENPHLPKSFTQHLRQLISETAIARYENFKQLTTPFDENDFTAVLEGLSKLADMIKEDIKNDLEYYRKPFQR